MNESAFGRRNEADLVEALHRERAAVIALVAEVRGEIVGHILFSPITLESGDTKCVVSLGPMAVAPRYQKQGVGSLLVRAGLERCRAQGFDGVVVLGHSGYYPRFGFVPALRFGLHSEYEVPADVFMAVELSPGSLSGVSGLVRYHNVFGQV